MVIIWERIEKINDMEKNEVSKELFETMKKHIINQFKNDNETGFQKGYNGKTLQTERAELINKLLK